MTLEWMLQNGVVPVMNDSEPLTPAAPAFAVRMLKTPLDVAEP